MKGRILITGGTGSLGQAIVARAEKEGWNCEFTILSRDEVKQGDMAQRFPHCRYVLGDVRDYEWLKIIFRDHSTVIHAAAFKRVPSAEVNVSETISTNVVGSRNVAMASVSAGVPHVLGISTDKACQPANAYGESKALMEKLFQEACRWNNTQFNLVRYGNVLGTRGSVVPLFQKQSQEGSITLTDPEMTRFWLTLEDAVDIVIRGLRETKSGTIIIPKAPASTMRQLAEAMAPTADIRVIGSRPGEKRHEQLVHQGESPHAQNLEGYFRLWPAYLPPVNELPPSYEYRSDTAPQLTVAGLRTMLGLREPVGVTP